MARKAAKRKTANKKTANKKATTRKTAKKKATTKKNTAKKVDSKSRAKKTTAQKTTSRAIAAEPVKKVRNATRPKNTNTNSYTQSEFVENIRQFCGLQKRSQAKEICEDISLFVRDSLKKGYRIPLMGLGKLYVRQSKARMGRNPATGELIHIPARKRVRFSPAKALKDAVL